LVLAELFTVYVPGLCRETKMNSLSICLHRNLIMLQKVSLLLLQYFQLYC